MLNRKIKALGKKISNDEIWLLNLTKNNLEDYYFRLEEIDNNASGEIETAWSAEDYLAEMECKWKYSYLALDKGNKIIGFLIGGIIKKDTYKILKFVMNSENNGYKQKEFILNEVVNNLRKDKISRIVFPVNVKNAGMIQFCQKAGLARIDGDYIKSLISKGKKLVSRSNAPKLKEEGHPENEYIVYYLKF